MPATEYRPATPDDAASISKLIIESQQKYCFHEYTDDGKKLMLRLCSTEAIKSYIERGDVYLVALDGSEIIGVAGLRDNDHLTHNFVDDRYHRKGISAELWRLAKAECGRRGNDGSYNLQASTYAIPVYEKWGFVQTGETNQEYGITSTPMKLECQ